MLKQLQDRLSMKIVFWIAPNDIGCLRLILLGLVIFLYLLHLLETQSLLMIHLLHFLALFILMDSSMIIFHYILPNNWVLFQLFQLFQLLEEEEEGEEEDMYFLPSQ